MSLSVDDIINDVTLTINEKLFRGRIPFDEFSLSDDEALLEDLNFDDFIQESSPHAKEVSSKSENTSFTNLRIKKDGILSVLGIYIEIGMDSSFDEKRRVTSSNQDKENASCSWANVGLPLSTPLNVKRGEIISIKCKVEYFNEKCNYFISLLFKKISHTFEFTQKDLFGVYKDLHTF